MGRSKSVTSSAVVPFAVYFMALPVIVVLLPWFACAAPVPQGRVNLVGDHAIEFPATVSVAAFDGEFDMASYHFLVWADGRASDRALLTAHVSDIEVLDALEGFGAMPGNAVGIEAWDNRYSRESSAADTVIEGPQAKITVHVPDRDEPLSLDDILIEAPMIWTSS